MGGDSGAINLATELYAELVTAMMFGAICCGPHSALGMAEALAMHRLPCRAQCPWVKLSVSTVWGAQFALPVSCAGALIFRAVGAPPGVFSPELSVGMHACLIFCFRPPSLGELARGGLKPPKPIA